MGILFPNFTEKKLIAYSESLGIKSWEGFGKRGGKGWGVILYLMAIGGLQNSDIYWETLWITVRETMCVYSNVFWN